MEYLYRDVNLNSKEMAGSRVPPGDPTVIRSRSQVLEHNLPSQRFQSSISEEVISRDCIRVDRPIRKCRVETFDTT